MHPAFGSITAQYLNGEILHFGDQPEYCELRAEFIEDMLGTPSFDAFSTLTSLAALQQADAPAQVAAATGLSNAMAAAPTTGKLGTIGSYINAMDVALTNALTFASNVGADAINSLNLAGIVDPFTFASSLQTIFSQRIAALLAPFQTIGALTASKQTQAGSATFAPYAPSGAVTSWSAPAANIRQSLLSGALNVPAAMALHVQQQTALALAQLCQGMLTVEQQNASLTPQDVRAIAADVRVDLQAAIGATQALWPMVADSRPMTEALKAVAAQVQNAANALINSRPPFIAKQAPSAMSLMLLAFWWYSDYTRADELLRLNPQIRNPNFIAQGQTIYGYAV